MGLPGSQRTVQRLVDDHYAPLYRYAYRLSGSAADARAKTRRGRPPGRARRRDKNLGNKPGPGASYLVAHRFWDRWTASSRFAVSVERMVHR